MKTCSDCHMCSDGKYCEPFRPEIDRNYDGIRFTADSFDCAIHVSFDNYSTCSFGCLYCFSNFLTRDPYRKKEYKIGKHSLISLDRFLTLDNSQVRREYQIMQNEINCGNGKRRPMQWGALGDPFDNIERWQGYSLELAKLFVKHKQPTRISTKGGLVIAQKEYLDALSYPDIFWVAFSIISADDEMLQRVDRNTPNCTQRLKAMSELSKRGVSTSLRFRPIIPNVSDRTPKKPKAWKELLHRAREAGAKALSMEFIFVPLVQPLTTKKRFQTLEDVASFPLTKFYKANTAVQGLCLRADKYWKEDLIFACKEECKKIGMVFAVSDPHWKELNESGCCCGILPDDPVFGNWQRKNGLQGLLTAKENFEKTGYGEVHWDDVCPPWYNEAIAQGMFCVTGAKGALGQKKKETWGEHLRYAYWNDPKAYRSPLNYFQDVLHPVGLDDKKNIVYKYVPAERKHKKTQWDV